MKVCKILLASGEFRIVAKGNFRAGTPVFARKTYPLEHIGAIIELFPDARAL